MPEFKIANEQTKVLAHLLTELTDRDVLKWKHFCANCYSTRVGTQTFSFCQWHEGLEVSFDSLRFRGYDYGLSELRAAVYGQRKRLEKAEKLVKQKG